MKILGGILTFVGFSGTVYLVYLMNTTWYKLQMEFNIIAGGMKQDLDLLLAIFIITLIIGIVLLLVGNTKRDTSSSESIANQQNQQKALRYKGRRKLSR